MKVKKWAVLSFVVNMVLVFTQRCRSQRVQWFHFPSSMLLQIHMRRYASYRNGTQNPKERLCGVCFFEYDDFLALLRRGQMEHQY